MKTMTYTNAQLRSILNGLGYANPDETAKFPLSTDDSSLTDTRSVQAIQKFQIDHQLEVSGVVDSSTLSAIEQVMQNLISELNRVNPTAIPLDQPVYDAATIAAVKLVQQRIPANGIASHSLQDALAKQQDSQLVPYPSYSLAQAIFYHHGDYDW